MNLRNEMPSIAAFIDDMRDAFGVDEVNAVIRRGMQGQPVFWAKENGHEIGTRAVIHGTEVSAANMVIRRPEEVEAEAGMKRGVRG